MMLSCFYYPELKNNSIVKCNKKLKIFNFGDEVPTKTLYYNYGKDFIYYQDDEFYLIENHILKRTLSKDEIKYPLKLVFNGGTQLTVPTAQDLTSVRLTLKGEYELEKELGSLFYLSMVFNRRIKNIQYSTMSELTNSSRDYNYINEEMNIRTKDLIEQLRLVEDKFSKLINENPGIKETYLEYMDFSEREDILEVGINKYFIEGTEENEEYVRRTLIWKSKPIYPKFKLDHFIDSCNYRNNA